jgi:hypothetical protein
VITSYLADALDELLAAARAEDSKNTADRPVKLKAVKAG